MRSIGAVTSLGMKVIGCSIHLIPTNWEINLMVECNPYMVNAKFRLLHLLLKILVCCRSGRTVRTVNPVSNTPSKVRILPSQQNNGLLGSLVENMTVTHVK